MTTQQAPYSAAETTSQKMRRLMAKAAIGNPVTTPPLVGSLPWAASTAVLAGQVRSKNGNAYVCATSGTTASSGGPTGRGAAISDGTAAWDYYGPQTAPSFTLLSSKPAELTTAIAFNDSRLRILGATITPDQTFGTTGLFPQVSCGLGIGNVQHGLVVGGANQAGLNGSLFGIEINTDAAKVCFEFLPTSEFFNFVVDGVYISPDLIGGTNSGHQYVTIDFSTLPGQGYGASATAVVTGGVVTGFTSVVGGQQYDPNAPPQVRLVGGGASNATAYATVNADGSLSFTVKSGGSSYTSAPTVVIVTGKKKRRIVLESGQNLALANVWVSPIDKVFGPTTADHVRAVWFGDSWIEGIAQQSVAGRRLGLANVCSHLMGWDDCWNSGAGGTGYAAYNLQYDATITPAITASASPQTVALSSILATLNATTTYNLQAGQYLDVTDGANSERIWLSAVNAGAGTITAVFTHNHAAGTAITGAVHFNSLATSITSGAITGSGTAQNITLASITTPGGATLASGSYAIIDPTGTPETVHITGLTGNVATAIITQNHAAGALVYSPLVFELTHAQRYIDVTTPVPDIAIIGPTGINDSSLSASRSVVAANALKLLKAIRAAMPNLPIIVFGNQANGLFQSMLDVDNGIGDAVTAMNDPRIFFCPIAGSAVPWIGAGATTNPQGGSGDALIAGSNNHPVNEGHKLMGTRCFEVIKGVVAAANW